MIKSGSLNLPTSSAPLAVISQDTFRRGVISLIDQSKLPKDALKEASNIMLREDGAPGPRWGTNWYGNAAPNGAAIDGSFMYETSAGAVHLIMVAGGNVYRSVDDGTTWTLCTGATLTAGKKCFGEQAAGFYYIINGTDNMVRYDGSTTLQVYTALALPVGNTPTKTGLAGTGAYTYYYRVSAVNNVGFTAASVATSILVDRQRDRFDTSNYITFTWGAVAGATRYDIYMGIVSGQEVYIDSVSSNSTTYIDNGSAFENDNIVAPTSNTTTGPLIADIAFVGSRLWGTRDPNNLYRAWWSGSGPFIGYFSVAYDGGYIDLQSGSQFHPVAVRDYRDGKGTPLATVWCKSKDGRGCIWQISLDSLTVGNTTVTVPNAYKLPGSRGTNAPGSIVNVLNDFYYYNSQAFYNLGSRAQMLNLLSTDEASVNIRPDVQNISIASSDGITGIYYRSKLFVSVPYGTTTNSATIVLDTEINGKPWLPQAFTVGFERFFQYTDSLGSQHLLAWKPGDNRLTEISQSIAGDYSQPFATSLTTGLIYVSKNRFDFLWCEEAEVEFTQPKGAISIELIGIERNAGFKSLKSASIQPRTTNVGWGTFAWSTKPWSDTSVVPQTYSESSIKRYFNVQKEINAYQYHITTNSIDADYVLRTLQINGTPTDSGKPRQWRL